MPVVTLIELHDGQLLLPTDNCTDLIHGTAIHLSRDGGVTWRDPGTSLSGLHGAVVELKNGSLLAFGREHDEPGECPGGICQAQSISHDQGVSWSLSASPFPAVHGGQRHWLLRLKSGKIVFQGFCNVPCNTTTTSGKLRPIKGMFITYSLDEGATWSNFKLISDNLPPHPVQTTNGAMFNMSKSQVRPLM